jgi:hypothetical protein
VKRNLLPVSQADRNAEAFLMDHMHGLQGEAHEQYLSGAMDSSRPVQAFARHRMQSQLKALKDHPFTEQALFGVIRAAGRKDSEKARAVHDSIASVLQKIDELEEHGEAPP